MIERSLDVMVDRPILGMSSLVLVSIVLASGELLAMHVER